METTSFVRQTLQQAHLRLQATCEGLRDEQARSRPAPRSNSISFILWHIARVEDELVAAETAVPTLWRHHWHARFGHPLDTPSRDEREILLGLELPPLDDLRAFLDETYSECRGFLDTLTDPDLDRASRVWPGRPLATSLRHLATHKNNHHGQVDYLRGLQDQNWDLPPGTGVVLDD